MKKIEAIEQEDESVHNMKGCSTEVDTDDYEDEEEIEKVRTQT